MTKLAERTGLGGVFKDHIAADRAKRRAERWLRSGRGGEPPAHLRPFVKGILADTAMPPREMLIPSRFEELIESDPAVTLEPSTLVAAPPAIDWSKPLPPCPDDETDALRGKWEAAKAKWEAASSGGYKSKLKKLMLEAEQDYLRACGGAG